VKAALWASLVAASLELGCDPVMEITGEVRSIPSSPRLDGDVYASGVPIAGATATLDCHERTVIGKTDAQGRFRWGGVGWLETACSVEISAVGYYPERIRIGDACVLREGESCHFLKVLAELVPRAGP